MPALEPLIEKAEWQKAEDQREYVVLGKEPQLYNGMKAIIKSHGYSKQVNDRWGRYFDHGSYSYNIKENVLYRTQTNIAIETESIGDELLKYNTREEYIKLYDCKILICDCSEYNKPQPCTPHTCKHTKQLANKKQKTKPAKIQCNQCGECCRWFVKTWAVQSKTARDFYRTRGLIVKGLNVTLINKNHPCPQLEDNKCKLHGKRKPYACKKYPTGAPPHAIPPGCAFKPKEEI